MSRREIADCDRGSPRRASLLKRRFSCIIWRTLEEGVQIMASLDWSQCPAVESVPGRRSGAWVFKDSRMPVATVFENLEAGSDIEEIIEQFHVTREQVQAVLEFAARSLDAPPVPVGASTANDAHPL
jgi:uncharacterized protein (DUF433 family)